MKTVRVPTEALIEVILLQLKTGQKANLTVTGYSMMPMLHQYTDTVQLKPVDGALQPGDVALYLRDSGQYVLHRVIRLTSEGYLFCGDNQAELEPVRQDQLIALVDGYTKKGRLYRLDTIGYQMYCFVFVKLFGFRKYYIWLRRRFGYLRNRLLKWRKANEQK